MTYYSQNDPRWKNTKIGFDTGPTDTIGNYGCYMTAIANVCVFAENDLNPSQINDLCKSHSGWLVSSDLIGNDSIPALLCNNLEYIGKTSWNDATSMNFFADASDPNVAYIICIDASHAPGIQTHFVMVWSTLGTNDLEILDSWDGVKKPLSHYGNPSVIIQSATKFIKSAAVVTPAAPAAKYTITETYNPAKQIQLNKQPTNLWGMNFDFNYMKDHPVEVHNQGEIWEVTNKVHHEDGYDYYRRDGQVDGFNVLDCDDYSPPPPVYVPPAAPTPVVMSEIYTLMTSLPTYAKDTDAMSAVNSVGTLPVGTYYVWDKVGDIYQLGVDNIHDPTNNWIDTGKNVAPVVPTKPTEPEKTTDSSSDIIGSFRWFHADHHPEEYTVLKGIVVYDMLHGGKPSRIDEGDVIHIYGHFTKDGYTYLRPLTGADQQSLYYYYGIRTTDVTTWSGAPFLESKLNWVKKLEVVWESLYDKAVKSIDGVFRRKK